MTGRPGPPSVAIVVLSWNGMADTLRCLDSLAAVSYPDLRVVLVDNGSTDATVATVAERHPEVEVLALGSNTGFCAGNNAGLRWSLDQGFDLIGVLNNDTVVDPGFLEPLVDRLVGDPLAAVSPLITYLDRPDEVWFGGSRLDAGVGIVYHRDEADLSVADAAAAVRSVPAITGCCLVATREVWRAVGLFDERFFLIFEDADWSARARAAGCSTEVVVASTVRHAVSASFATAASAFGDYYYVRNGLLYIHDNGAAPRRQSARFLGRVARESLAGAVRHPGPGWTRGRAQAAGALDFARGRFGPRVAGRRRPESAP